MKELISVTATKKRCREKKKVRRQNFFVLNVSSIFIMEIRETTQETFKNFLREWMFHRWRSTFVVKKKDFLEMMDLYLFYYLTCFLRNNSNFVGASEKWISTSYICFVLVCAQIYSSAIVTFGRGSMWMFFWQSINACAVTTYSLWVERFSSQISNVGDGLFLDVYHQKI